MKYKLFLPFLFLLAACNTVIIPTEEPINDSISTETFTDLGIVAFYRLLDSNNNYFKTRANNIPN